ncbi:MAG TPA: peptidyl-alpha-hydroxyglycine alpha-amidating lyase family protein [Gemmatimonadales bacterium]|nr:peptidyl-alpha-hydroxyglycine alpha-amidating lyase family protein [Gemmatimonadales bacterium]
MSFRRHWVPRHAAGYLILGVMVVDGPRHPTVLEAKPRVADTGYRVVHGWPVLPESEMLGITSAVAVDSHNHVFVLDRRERVWPNSDTLDTAPIDSATVRVFDGPTGVRLAEWGAGTFAMPHGITIDASDHVWLTDVALHQVYKYSHDGKLLLAVGVRGVPGEDTVHFNRPSGVVAAPDGSFFVSDGYGNNRVMAFAPDGRFLFQWGTKGSGPGQFDLPHGIARDPAGRLYVSDRSNGRVQIFDAGGRYLKEWKSPALASPNNVAFAPDGNALVVDDGGKVLIPDRSGIAVLGPDGSFIGRFGRFGNYDGQFVAVHSVAVGPDGAVYVADADGKRVQKFVRVQH